MEKIEILQNVIGSLQKEEEKEKQRQEEIKKQKARIQEYANLKSEFFRNFCKLGIEIAKKEASQITPKELEVLPEMAKLIFDSDDNATSFKYDY